MNKETESDGGSVRSVIRSLAVLEHLAQAEPARVGEIALAVGLSKSTTQRVLRTLKQADWIRAVPGDTTKWEISRHARAVFLTDTPDAQLRRVALPFMEELRDRTGETVHLTVPIELGRVVIAERAESQHEVRSVLPVGTRFDIGEVAGGRALLGDADEKGWVSLTSPTGQSTGIASPVRSGSLAVAALVVVVPMGRINEDTELHFGRLVADAAKRLSHSINA